VEGGVPDVVQAIKERRWRDVRSLTDRDRALCEVAEKLSATPTRMTEEDWMPLRRLGFDDRACLEVAHIVGIFNHLTRLADGFGLELDAGTREAAETQRPLRRGGRPEAP
jgi:uncharacterized peroxidase-related enzyme